MISCLPPSVTTWVLHFQLTTACKREQQLDYILLMILKYVPMETKVMIMLISYSFNILDTTADLNAVLNWKINIFSCRQKYSL
jgi:hypothetical protein